MICATSLTIYSQPIYSQQRAIYITGDHVNIRRDTNSTERSHYQADWGTKFLGEKISQQWFSVFLEYEMDYVFISTKYAAEENNFIRLAEEKREKNGKTKFELMLLYKKYNQSDKAQTLLFEILNNHSRELYMLPDHEWCVLLGPYSYKKMIESSPEKVNYDDQKTLALTERVLEKIKDSIIVAIALTDQAKYYLAHQNSEKAEDILLNIIQDYASHLFVPVPCDYDYDGKIYPEVNLKIACNDLFQKLDKSRRKKLIGHLEKISLKNKNPKSKILAEEIISELNVNDQKSKSKEN